MATREGPTSIAQANLEASLADSTNFRTWAGAADQAAALARIYHDGIPRSIAADSHTLAQVQSLRPYVIVWTENDESERDAVSNGPDRSDSGELGMMFVQDIDPGDVNDIQEAGRKLMNAMGTIRVDLFNLAGDGHIVPSRIGMPQPWTHTGENDEPAVGDALIAIQMMDWGAEVS
jgi:hypothetical protein